MPYLTSVFKRRWPTFVFFNFATVFSALGPTYLIPVNPSSDPGCAAAGHPRGPHPARDGVPREAGLLTRLTNLGRHRPTPRDIHLLGRECK